MLEEEFGQRFFRVHRNALVDPKRLARLSNNENGQWQLSFQDIDDTSMSAAGSWRKFGRC